MRMYVRSNSKPEKVLRINIEIVYGFAINDSSVAASQDFDYSKHPVLNKRTKDKLQSDFDDFKDTIIEMTESLGFVEYENHSSNRDGSISWYFSFVRETELNILKVEYMFFMRVSDHILPNETESGFNRKQAEKQYREHVTKSARWMNPSLPEDVNIIPVPINISIDSETNYTYMNALDEVKKKLMRFRKE